MVPASPRFSNPLAMGIARNGPSRRSPPGTLKVVARKMLQMTANINSQWKPHVADTGVTCYTCHRGQPVPKNTWAMNPGNLPETGGWNASRMGQNLATKEVGTTSMHYDPFTDLLSKREPIRVAAQTVLPEWWLVNFMPSRHSLSILGVSTTSCP